MTFKVNDLVLCIDNRGVESYGLREGSVYNVITVETCCITRLGLFELPPKYVIDARCVMCGGPHVTHANFYARRFVKVARPRA